MSKRILIDVLMVVGPGVCQGRSALYQRQDLVFVEKQGQLGVFLTELQLDAS